MRAVPGFVAQPHRTLPYPSRSVKLGSPYIPRNHPERRSKPSVAVIRVSIIILLANGDRFRPRSSTPCRCVANIPMRTRSVKFLHHCACHSSAVPCFRSAAKLVDKYSGFSGYDVQHLSNFRHLNCVRAQPLRGESVEDILTMRESKKGTLALFTGQCNPHDARSAAAAVARRTVLFPAMFGPVKILIPSSSTSFTTASSRSIQKGTRPVKCHGVDASFAGRSCAGRHPRLTACLACRDTAVATVENVAADTKSATNNSRSPARARSAPATSLPASNDVTRYLSSAVSRLPKWSNDLRSVCRTDPPGVSGRWLLGLHTLGDGCGEVSEPERVVSFDRAQGGSVHLPGLMFRIGSLNQRHEVATDDLCEFTPQSRTHPTQTAPCLDEHGHATVR